MKIYLVRHGEAVSKYVDPECPLSDSGRAEVREVAAFLEEAGVRVGRVLHSGKARAAETAGILAASVLPGGAVEETEGLRPLDSVASFENRILGWDQDVMAVGHMPFMASLVALLTSGAPEGPSVSFDTATVVCLGREEEGRWTIAWSVGPRQVGD